MSEGSFIYDGTAVEIRSRDTLLSALVRHGVHPTGGGPLCASGDCPSCIVEVDGVAYTRACQRAAERNLVVRSHSAGSLPPMPSSQPSDDVAIAHVHADVVVVGAGRSGSAEADRLRNDGRDVVVHDASQGDEVVGVYSGPDVVVRSAAGLTVTHADEVVIATGAAPVLPVCPGSDLRGIMTPFAAETLTAQGVDLGRVATVGPELVRFEGIGQVEAVVARGPSGEVSTACDTAVVDLGTTPRDVLARMGAGLAVRTVGGAASEGELPLCPSDGVVCPCNDVSIADLHDAFDRGFGEIELLKRGTLAGAGFCQGGVCGPYLRSFLAERGAPAQPSFTARPVGRPLTFGEAAAGHFDQVALRTGLDAEHRALGAAMDRIGGWWRPWSYGDLEGEYEAVRERVSIGDVGTLGKMHLSGPDAELALQRLYPTDVATIRPGRLRYVLMLTERGTVLDDGMICREADGDRFYLTFTSGGASTAEMWIRDWTSDLDVRLMNVTASLGAINVTGPSAGELLGRLGFDEVGFLRHDTRVVAGVPCRVLRLSFTGERSYELHHGTGDSVALWRALLEAGDDLGVRPHGLEALMRLRLEKGHLIVGQDTDYDSTPRRLDHRWAVNLDKGDFLGRRAVVRTDRVPLDKQLVGLEVEGDPPFEGAVAWSGGDYAGYVTSAAWSPARGSSIALAWLFLRGDDLPAEVTIEGALARRVPLPFYDPDGGRVRG